MTFRFLHAADLHLDSPLRGLDRYEGAPAEEIRGATRRALENLVDLAISEDVAFVVIAGDVYDGDWQDYHTGLFFAGQMARLSAVDIPVYLISGNHDAASQITRKLPLPENVHTFPTKKAETVTIDSLGVAIHGQGFAKRDVSDDLSAGYPAPVAGHFNLALLHTALTGRAGHDNYAPCTVEGLEAKGYDYWALGHVHEREVIKGSAPAIVFPGNIQGRHAREIGEKGASLVTVENGTIATIDHRVLDVLRWDRKSIALDGVQDEASALALVKAAIGEAVVAADGRTLALRIELAGTTPLDRAVRADPTHWINAMRALALGHAVWIEKVIIRTSPPSDSEGQGDEVLGALRAVDPSGVVESLYGQLPERAQALLKKQDGLDTDTILADANAKLEAGLR